ncbi:unnamed protein product [Rotaria socialis]|uniref:Uncharacterized protein n=1 Tax=Rotaria socialis TaxID=392032 RepID=A0A817QX19_9BILA|nr:unnamed protein product [Rotaria socialis]CAF3330239.1 unnamed protein product [Rotaria socialis]CAF3451970.1 unnamed protein product [Rotaria socialis]CAF4350269.1 unnamed protein product [Rotaria socialis]CAF4482593.1 unnamed protein product [Rotaria socialis]
MSRWRQRFTETEILAIGIEGDRDSLCGAIQRFERYGIQSNGLLSLKEQCARYIARIKNDQTKWFITASLPPHLFQYVTKDIFNLQHHEFISNYADEYDLCNECSVNTSTKQRTKCHCPKLERAINKLNKYFSKRMNNNNNVKTRDIKKFELIYKFPDCDGDYNDYCDGPPLFFLYISPCIISDRKSSINDDLYDMDNMPYHSCRLIHQVSVDEKLLFVDVMKFFGGFETKHEQPEFILYHCQEHEL